MNVNELLDLIGNKRQRLNKMYAEYKDGMVKLAELKMQLLDTLNQAGLKSAKNDHFGVSIVQKPKLDVVNESAVREWLENAPNVEADAYIGLKLTPFKQLATTWFKDTGEMIDGVEYSSEESLTIRNNKK